MSNFSQRIRYEMWGFPCVCIDLDHTGEYAVYADPGVLVFSRRAEHEDDEFRFEEANVIPNGWLDGSTPADERADAYVKAFDNAEGEPDDDE